MSADQAFLLATILDASTEYSIVATELDGTILLWNEGARRIYGYPPAEALGRNIRILHFPGEAGQAEFDRIFAEALAQGRWEGVVMRLRRDGSSFPCRVALTVRQDGTGRPGGFLSISKDISDEILTHERLKDTEAYNRILIESATDGIMTIDLDGRITDVNQEMLSLSGRTREGLIGQPLREILVHASGADEAISRAIRDGRLNDLELALQRPGGEIVDVSFDATIFQVGHDRAKQVIANVRDVTDSKRLRDQLAQRNQELEVQNRRVEQANQMKSEFLAGISHELRTPLNSIIGFSDFLLTAEDDRLAPDQREYLTDILNSGNHLLQLINDILDLAKVESGKLELAPSSFLVGAAVEEVCSSLRPQLAARQLGLHTELSPAVQYVVLDVVRFKQILYNLLSNAVKFTPERGSIHVQVSSENAARFRVEVRDSGIGIAREDLARIFREFEQVDSGPSRKYQGTGLGLPLTQKLVAMMGGTIGVESEVGRGSTFTVRLPLEAPRTADRLPPGRGIAT